MKRFFVIVSGLIMADCIITFWYWPMETNPLALEIGKWFFVSIKLTLLPIFAGIWYEFSRDNPILEVITLTAVGTVYMAVLLTNLMMLA